MNAKQLTEQFYKSNHQRYEIIAPNVYPCWRFKEMDIMAIRKSGFVDEIEVKLTKSDFLADFKKTVNIECKLYVKQGDSFRTMWNEESKHECLSKGLNHCNYFSFLMTKDLSKKCDIPEYAGLYIFDDNRLREIKKPKRLHSRKISLELKYHIAKKLCYRFWNNKDLF